MTHIPQRLTWQWHTFLISPLGKGYLRKVVPRGERSVSMSLSHSPPPRDERSHDSGYRSHFPPWRPTMMSRTLQEIGLASCLHRLAGMAKIRNHGGAWQTMVVNAQTMMVNDEPWWWKTNYVGERRTVLVNDKLCWWMVNHGGEQWTPVVNSERWWHSMNHDDTRWTMMTSLHPSSFFHTAGQRTYRRNLAIPALPDSSVMRAMANPLLLQYIHFYTSCQRQPLTHRCT